MTEQNHTSRLLVAASRPAGSGATLNPFVVVDGAADFIEFVVDVFGGVEIEDARAPMPDGRLIHAEIILGDTHLLMAERIDGWPSHPGLLQVWVDDVAATLEDATAAGARVVTPATPFWVETTVGRMVDPWDNLWWLFSPAPGQPDPLAPWEGEDDTVFETIDAEMRSRASR
ncbi:MAG: VOC family protein [Acidimicrobiia bacterium]